jgi:hypothetical protein
MIGGAVEKGPPPLKNNVQRHNDSKKSKVDVRYVFPSSDADEHKSTTHKSRFKKDSSAEVHPERRNAVENYMNTLTTPQDVLQKREWMKQEVKEKLYEEHG